MRTIIERKRWNKHHQNSGRVAARYESPARKCRVKWNKCASPVGTTRVLTYTLKPACVFALGGTTDVALFPKRFMRRSLASRWEKVKTPTLSHKTRQGWDTLDSEKIGEPKLPKVKRQRRCFT